MNYADNNNNIKLVSTSSNQYFTCQHVQNILEKRQTSEKKPSGIHICYDSSLPWKILLKTFWLD